jgi:hypothetical protein
MDSTTSKVSHGLISDIRVKTGLAGISDSSTRIR